MNEWEKRNKKNRRVQCFCFLLFAQFIYKGFLKRLSVGFFFGGGGDEWVYEAQLVKAYEWSDERERLHVGSKAMVSISWVLIVIY